MTASPKFKKFLTALRYDPIYLLNRSGLTSPFFLRHHKKALSYLSAKHFFENIRYGVTKKDDIFQDKSKLFDLAHIHRQVSNRAPKTILEFGCGTSTVIMAYALEELEKTGAVKNPHLHVVEASPEWIKIVESSIPDHLKKYVTFHASPAVATEYESQIAHRHTILPDIIPDFIYLDGPSPANVTGQINGISFDISKPPISLDILLYEPLLRTGAFIILDGRVNNMYFLKRNLKRKYRFAWNRICQYSTFELIEKRDFKPARKI